MTKDPQIRTLACAFTFSHQPLTKTIFKDTHQAVNEKWKYTDVI